jgi:hypothetical protein
MSNNELLRNVIIKPRQLEAVAVKNAIDVIEGWAPSTKAPAVVLAQVGTMRHYLSQQQPERASTYCTSCGHDYDEIVDGVCEGLITVNGEYVNRVCGCTRGREDER